MTWHLKDRELEKKLIAIDPDFTEKLNQNCEIWDSNHDGDLCELMHFEQILRYKNKLLGNLLFTGVQLEEAPEYNPKDWNEFPKVKPPYDVMMRIETCTGDGCKGFYKRLEDGDRWCNPNHLLMTEAFSDIVERFRPWED